MDFLNRLQPCQNGMRTFIYLPITPGTKSMIEINARLIPALINLVNRCAVKFPSAIECAKPKQPVKRLLFKKCFTRCFVLRMFHSLSHQLQFMNFPALRQLISLDLTISQPTGLDIVKASLVGSPLFMCATMQAFRGLSVVMLHYVTHIFLLKRSLVILPCI